MRVFLTGATGFIGSAIIPELIGAGHQVIGLTRSEEGAKALAAAGAEAHHGTLEDPDTLRSGAAKADAVIHCAFDHNMNNFVANCEKDKRNIEALGAELAGSNRPLIVTSGTGLGSKDNGEPATEDVTNYHHPNPRKLSEMTADAVAANGVNVSVVRLPQVHDPVKQGLITYLVPIMREKGYAAYIGEGANRWPAAHISDVARLYVLAIERAEPNARYHAVAEEGVSAKAIAEALARGFKVSAKSITPEEAGAYFGWMAMFAGMDMPASSAITRKKLGWNPTGPDLISDLDRMKYE